MATWGATNNTNIESNRTDACWSSGTFATPGGVIVDLFANLKGWSGSATWRFAIYQGGVSGDPTGATLIKDFGEVTQSAFTVDAWKGMVADYGKTGGGTLAAGALTWIMARTTNGQMNLSNSAAGNLVTSPAGSERSNQANSTSTAYPGTWPTDAGTVSAEVIKAYISYTPTAGGVLLRSSDVMGGGMASLQGGMRN